MRPKEDKNYRGMKKRIKEGKCKSCSSLQSPRSKTYCEYHLGYTQGFSKATHNWRMKIERLLIR